MGKKKLKLPDTPEDQSPEVSEENSVVSYSVKNLTQSVFPVEVYDENGQVKNLQIRIQGRGGQTPPVILSTAVTEQMRSFVKKGFLRLIEVKG